MPLDPPLRAILEAVGRAQPDPPADLHERRRQADETMLLASTGPEAGVTTTDHPVAVNGGEITVRVTAPEPGDGPMPALLFLHGGGWFQGNLDTAAVECGPMASTVPCAVVSVGYRLAPEHPFPAPLEDCIAAYVGFYVPDPAQRTDPLASPLLADDLAGLPPAVVVVAEHDPVRDDGDRYVERLHAAGVPAAGVRVLAHPHGGWVVPVTATHGLVFDLHTAALRRAFAGTLVPSGLG
jgi:acetyl esterase/lipase